MMLKIKKVLGVIISGLFFLIGLVGDTTFADEINPTPLCGEFIHEDYRFPVEDCANPFSSTKTEVGFMIDRQVVTDGSTVIVDEEGIQNYGFAGENYYHQEQANYYRHDEVNFVLLELNFEEPAHAEVEAKMAEYFSNNHLKIVQYTQIYDAPQPESYFYDETTNSSYFDVELNKYVEEVYYEMVDFIKKNVTSKRVPLTAGTYTVARVDTDEGGNNQVSYLSPIKKLVDFILPTAYAYYDIHTITFTLATSTPKTGPASVLFLPGIMGSRLFEDSAECSLFGAVDKRERWPTSSDCDISRLDIDASGSSENVIFTEQDDGVIADIYGVVNLYESLLEDLEQWKEEDLIADYLAIPYDWRISLYDILKMKNIDGQLIFEDSGTYKDGYLYHSLEALALASPSGEVVLVGHSNGGLVIKALLANMKANNDPLLSAVKKVVLVAVPQNGTPDALVGLLHGVEMGPFGAVVSNQESRNLMNTALFAYHLLPNAEYYEMTETPAIVFESGTSTDPWRTQFGSELDTLAEVTTFLAKESGRTTPSPADTKNPATAYSHLLGYGQSVHNFLKDWKTGSTTVYELGGVGVTTPASIEYFTDTECIRTEPYISGAEVCVEFGPKLGYRVKEVIDGDGTVVIPSALAEPTGEGVEKWWLDLKRYGAFNINKKHSNILEVDEVRDLIINIANVDDTTTNEYSYLATSTPVFTGGKRLVYQLHSPLDMYAILYDGAIVGSSTPSVRDVEYRRYGEVQHLSIPTSETDYEVRLSGLATGSFTLDLEQYEGNTLEERVTYSALPSSTSTQVVIEAKTGDVLNDTELKIDYSGDGDFETTALSGLGQVTFVISTSTDETATSTTTVIKKSITSGTKIKSQTLPIVRKAEQTAGKSEFEVQKIKLLQQIIVFLAQYRDFLLKLKVQ